MPIECNSIDLSKFLKYVRLGKDGMKTNNLKIDGDLTIKGDLIVDNKIYVDNKELVGSINSKEAELKFKNIYDVSNVQTPINYLTEHSFDYPTNIFFNILSDSSLNISVEGTNLSDSVIDSFIYDKDQSGFYLSTKKYDKITKLNIDKFSGLAGINNFIDFADLSLNLSFCQVNNLESNNIYLIGFKDSHWVNYTDNIDKVNIQYGNNINKFNINYFTHNILMLPKIESKNIGNETIILFNHILESNEFDLNWGLTLILEDSSNNKINGFNHIYEENLTSGQKTEDVRYTFSNFDSIHIESSDFEKGSFIKIKIVDLNTYHYQLVAHQSNNQFKQPVDLNIIRF